MGTRKKLDEKLLIHLILAGKNDREAASELNVSHDIIYRRRRKLERLGRIPPRDGARSTKPNYVSASIPQLSRREPTCLKPHEVDAVYNLLNAAQRVEALELENSKLRNELGVLKESYAGLDARYNEINRRYQALMLEKRNPPDER